jgi:uncharacterized lipoprotein NlpE involved in copper resistance
MKQTILKYATIAIASITLVGCNQESEVASYNVSQAAHNFEVNRRVIFYNGITGEYILTIEGLLSVTPEPGKLSVIVKTGPSEYKKHYLGVSDNVTWFCEQIDTVKTDPFHYRVVFRPTTIVPDVEVKVR